MDAADRGPSWIDRPATGLARGQNIAARRAVSSFVVRQVAIGAGAVVTLVVVAGVTVLPGVGAGALLHPTRHVVSFARPRSCDDATLEGEGVRLRGWRCPAFESRRGTLIYLHGIADNRAGAAGVIARYQPRGFDVLAFDGRAHGESEGDACTYGFYEKRDLARIIGTLPPGPVVLVGVSLGAAIALQTAAIEPRVTAVVAAETFADLRSIAAERAPFLIRMGSFDRAVRLAERRAEFTIDAVSPLTAARAITVPVFVVHGAADRDTPPAHSRRVYEALAGAKHLEIVDGAGHGQSLRPEVWAAIDRWLHALGDLG